MGILYVNNLSILYTMWVREAWTAISLSDSGTNKENTMSKENIQLVVALIISIGFLFYVTTTSSDIKFPPPPTIPMGAG